MVTNLVCRLVQPLGVDGGTEAESNSRPKKLVIGEGSNSLVIDLGLYRISTDPVHTAHGPYLNEGSRVELVLSRNLKRWLARALSIPRSLSTGLNQSINPVVVRGGENA